MPTIHTALMLVIVFIKRGYSMSYVLRLRVKEVVTEKNISLNKLSQKSEVSYNIVRDIYHNPYRETSLHTLNRLANVLGVKPTTLLEDEFVLDDIADAGTYLEGGEEVFNKTEQSQDTEQQRR